MTTVAAVVGGFILLLFIYIAKGKQLNSELTTHNNLLIHHGNYFVNSKFT
jgi:hypothetical protein